MMATTLTTRKRYNYLGQVMGILLYSKRWSKIHLSVDTEKDINLMNKIFSKLGKMFTMEYV